MAHPDQERQSGQSKREDHHMVLHNKSLFSDHDIYLFKEGNHFRLYEKMGSHVTHFDGVKGTYFAVWAPNAAAVSVMGDFNGWDTQTHPLGCRWDSSGIWEGFIPGVDQGAHYKYWIKSKENGHQVNKRDPYAFSNELPPQSASVVWDLTYPWSDQQWMENRYKKNSLHAPIAIYEVHLGSWRRKAEENHGFLTYRELAKQMVDYVKEMGFTHVEFMPVMEHPFYGSWGYQTTGYFAPTQRYGHPQDLMYLIDQLHQNDIGVFLDWVPSHFPSDEYGLVYFDGTHLYEHVDPKKGFHPDWKSYIFNHGRIEVKEFLISNAQFWLDKYHVDGLRVDAVASMLYLDYSRKEGEWIPNQYGGNENIESIQFLRQLNEVIYQNFPDIQMTAEESTAWPGVSRPVHLGGLGFGMKWNMGWMHDNLDYFSKEPVHRKYHHNELTFSFLYTFTENFILSLSHDEVVHGKASLLSKMAGDDWQKFANLRLLFSYLYTHPGKKLLFMGGEWGQWNEWNHDHSLDWHLLNYAPHQGIKRLVEDLNKLYRSEEALYCDDFTPGGFQWIDGADYEQSIISFLRKGKKREDDLLIVCNFTPVTRSHYRIGVPQRGIWKEIFNSDAVIYGGSGQGNYGQKETTPISYHGQFQSLSLTLPPLGGLILKWNSPLS